MKTPTPPKINTRGRRKVKTIKAWVVIYGDDSKPSIQFIAPTILERLDALSFGIKYKPCKITYHP
jgi:hypothetical protein